MWKCPKCGRSFKNEKQHHFCSEAPKTIDEYILMQDENRREQLEQVRKAIAGSLPDATEKISWSMPTFWDGHNIIHFAAAKKHIGLYPGAEAVAHGVEIQQRVDTDSLFRQLTARTDRSDRRPVR